MNSIRTGLIRLSLGVLLSGVLAFPPAVEGVFDKNLSNSCIDCHSASPDKRLSQPFVLWSKSVHAQVGNTCDGCHGGNPRDSSENAMSKENRFYGVPQREQITSFCGKCHQELSKDFKKSIHWQTGARNCVDCHGSHTIQRISLEIINEDKCGECHGYAKPEKLKQVLSSLHDRFHAAKDKVKLIAGFPTAPVEKDLDKAWKKLRQVRMVSHTFDVPRVQAEAKPVLALIAKTDSKIDRLVKRGEDRRDWGYVVIFVFLFLALLTYFYNKQYREMD